MLKGLYNGSFFLYNSSIEKSNIQQTNDKLNKKNYNKVGYQFMNKSIKCTAKDGVGAIKKIRVKKSDKERIENNPKLQEKYAKMYAFFSWVFTGRTDKEYIRILQNDATNEHDATFTTIKFFNNLEDLATFLAVHADTRHNTYYELATTDGVGGTEDNILYRYCSVLDFDKKDLGEETTRNDIINKIKSVSKNYYYHQVVDSGHGYHVYTLFNRTSHIDQIDELQQELGKLFGADKNALKKTQLMRVPYSFNIKDKDSIKQVTPTLDLYKDILPTFKRLNPNKFYTAYCGRYAKRSKAKGEIVSTTLRNTEQFTDCLKRMLGDGSRRTECNDDLRHIVYILKNGYNYTQPQVTEIATDWAIKSEHRANIKKKVQVYYNDVKAKPIRCKNCPKFKECWYVKLKKEDINIEEEVVTTQKEKTEVTTLSESCAKRLGVVDNKTVELNSSSLLVLLVLKISARGLTLNKVLEILEYNGVSALTEKDVIEAIKLLEEMGYILANTKKSGEVAYKTKRERIKEEMLVSIGFQVANECIRGLITKDEMKLYVYLKFLLHMSNKEKGKTDDENNELRLNQDKIAESYGLSRSRIVRMIDSLSKQKLLIKVTDISEISGYVYNTYILTY